MTDPLAVAPEVGAAERGHARDRAIRRGALVTIAARGVLALGSILILAAAARSLSRPEFGLVATLASLYIVIANAGVGLGGVLMTRLAGSRGREDTEAMRQHVTNALTALGLIGGFIAVAGVASAFLFPWVRWLGAESLNPGEVRLCVALFFIFSGFAIVALVGSSVLVAMQRLATDQSWTAIGGIVAVALAAVASALDLPPWAYVVAITAAPSVISASRATWAIFVEYPYLRPNGPAKLDRRLWEFVRSSGYLAIINVTAAVSIGIDALVVASVKGASAAAIFNVASRMFLLLGTVLGFVGRQVWSALTEAIHRGDLDWARSRYRRALFIVGGIVTAACAFVVAIGRPFARVWAGPDLVPPMSLLIVMAIFTIVSSVANQAAVVLMATQRLRTFTMIGVIQTPLNLVASIIFTQHLGLVGPVVGSIAVAIPLLAPALWVLCRRALNDIHSFAPSSAAPVPNDAVSDDRADLLDHVDVPDLEPVAMSATQLMAPFPRTTGHERASREPRTQAVRARGRLVRSTRGGNSFALPLGTLAGLLFALGLTSGGGALVSISGFVILLCIAGATRLNLARAGLYATYGFVFTCSWTGYYIVGHQRPRALFLLLALALLLSVHVNDRLPLVPWWYLTFVGVVVLDTIVDVVLPMSQHYLDNRYINIPNGAFGAHLVTGIGDVGTGIRFLLTLVGGALAITICSLRFRRAPLWIAIAYCGGASLSALVGFTDSLGLTSLGRGLTGIGFRGNRATGFADHQDLMASANVYAISIAIWLTTHEDRRVRRAGLAMTISLILGTYASGSRGGALCIFLAVIVCMVVYPAYRRHLAFFILAGGLIVIATFLAAPSLGHKILVGTRLAGNAGASNDGRIAAIHQGLLDFVHSPLTGVGLHVMDEAHNVPVQTLAAGGLVLFVGFLCIQFGGAYEAYHLRRFNGLAAALFATMLVGAVFANLENLLSEPLIYVPICLIVALYAQRRADADEASARAAELTREAIVRRRRDGALSPPVLGAAAAPYVAPAAARP